MRRLQGAGPVAAALALRPWLWRVAAVTALRLAPPGWWRRWPPLPLPDGAYWHFRMVTAYGGAGQGAPSPRDVVDYLEWCRRTDRGSPNGPRQWRRRG